MVPVPAGQLVTAERRPLIRETTTTELEVSLVPGLTPRDPALATASTAAKHPVAPFRAVHRLTRALDGDFAWLWSVEF
jgi:hypothetical protein